MIDANSEISRLRQSLRFKNLSETIIDSICDDVAAEISDITTDLLASAMSEAVEAGQSTEFVEDIKSIRSGSTFNIVTQSGKTDYSEAPFPMLPKMLQNAKIAKDGSLYKVIPLKQKTDAPGRTQIFSEQALRDIENARKMAKSNRTNDNRGSSSPNAMKGMDTMSAMQVISKSRQKTEKTSSANVQQVNFRTVSSKQDPNTQWMHPGKKEDMGPTLRNINANLHDAIDSAIMEVIRKFEGEY
jgi:hypothetical protein